MTLWSLPKRRCLKDWRRTLENHEHTNSHHQHEYTESRQSCGQHRLEPGDSIIHDGAPGADTLAAEVAQELGIRARAYPADWRKHGRAAGPIRNQLMLDDGKPDILVAFPGGKGTADMIRRATGRVLIVTVA